MNRYNHCDKKKRTRTPYRPLFEAPETTVFQERQNKRPSEKVAGVRRIWGTLRGCSSKTVLTALQRLSTVADKVEVRRKFKKKKNNSVQWWFLIRGQELVLQQLEQQWEKIQTQTSWKLEHCHRPVSVPSNEETSPHNVSSFLSPN